MKTTQSFLEICKIDKTSKRKSTPLQKDGEVKTDNKDNAEILNDQF